MPARMVSSRAASASGCRRAAPAPGVRPVTTFEDATFGRVLATRAGQALCRRNREPDSRVRCTGPYARAWPPLLVPKRARVPATITGVQGRFGIVRRPDGRRQVTYQGRPIYAHAHEGPRQVLCNDADGLVRGAGTRPRLGPVRRRALNRQTLSCAASTAW